MFIDFMKNTSLFGYQSDDPAARAAYDMMVLDYLSEEEDDEDDE